MGCASRAESGVDRANTQDEITLHLKESSTIPIEAESINPDLFYERSHSEIKALPAFYGRRRVTLGDLFDVKGERSDHIVVRGDLQHVKRLGQGMRRGRIEVHGDAGPHLGARMRGGSIAVQGNTGDWAGAHMAGGRIWIHGNAGHHLGAAYPGDNRGVNRGLIIVDGNAGAEIGAAMRRGLIVVMGDAGDFAGARMIAGSIFIFGHMGKRAGAGMKRGSIVALGTCEPLLPTFCFELLFQPVFLNIFFKHLRKWGLPVDAQLSNGFFRRYSGDINYLGKGEILIHG